MTRSSPLSLVAAGKTRPTAAGVLQKVWLLEEAGTADPRTQQDQPAARTGCLELVGRSS